jgi:hypothetical protein
VGAGFRFRAAVSTFRRLEPVAFRFERTRALIAKWDGEGLEPDASAKDWLHRWLPVGIVLVSLAAAAMAWQASVAEERATHKDVLSRQDLVRSQQFDLEKIQQAIANLRVFGEVERPFLLAEMLEEQSAQIGGTQGRRLADEARANRKAFEALRRQADADPALASGTHYDVRAALSAIESGDRDLTSLEPNSLRAGARHQRTMGLRLAGLLVVFIVGLVFLTIAAVARGRLSYWFASGGAGAALVATILFFFVRVV